VADQPHVMVVEARFYDDIADELIKGTLAALEKGGATCERFQVPGSFEVPAAIAFAVRSMEYFTARQRFDGYVALGCVIRGETSHYEQVCAEVARGVASVALEAGLPVTFGVLTTENLHQAIERAGAKAGNKGWDAALAAIEMVSLFRSLE